MRRLKRRQPTPPEGVRWVRDSEGSEIPLECRYVGKRRGTHMWEAVISPLVDLRHGHMEVDKLPGHTSVQVVFAAEIELPPS